MRNLNPSRPVLASGTAVLPARRRLARHVLSGRGQAAAAAAILLGLAAASAAPAPDTGGISSRVLTNIAEIWSLPAPEKSLPHRLKTEMVIYYFDAAWKTASGECQGEPGWLPIADSPVPLKMGQRIAIDGLVLPEQERILWDQTRLTILQDSTALKPEPIRDLESRAREIHGRLVTVEGLLDQRQMEDATHITFAFLCGNISATAHILKGSGGARLPFAEGDFVRMTCVYAPQFDRDGKMSDLVVWVSRPEDVQVIGSLKSDSRFASPIRLSEDIAGDASTNNLFHVEGIVRRREPGQWVTLWDAAGQILVQSRQTQPLRVGDHVEAIGHPEILGVQRCLLDGIYRLSQSTNSAELDPVAAARKRPLPLAEQVRDLSREDAARHLPVQLYAIVSWHHNQTPFAFVEDASGGIRLANPKWESVDAEKPGSVVRIEGVTEQGGFVPVVTNAVVRKAGWWNLEEGRHITLQQALRGLEDGQWVQMGGFVRSVTNIDGLVGLDLSTPIGEFRAWVASSESLQSLRGSIVRVNGVCAAVVNSRHQLTGVEIWSPESRFVQIEEPAPEDVFSAVLRTPGDLRRFDVHGAPNQRVRTRGTVVLHAPGRYLYVQDGEDGVFVLSQQTDPLHPGDRVEIVGFPGNQGRRFLLRESVYRRIGSGAEPNPVRISAVSGVNLDWEGLLGTADGVLLNATEKGSDSRLLIHTSNAIFEASLGPEGMDSAEPKPDLQPGSRLSLTGVYEVQSDEYGYPRSFLLRLRSWKDVRLLQAPPWWTMARVVRVLLGVLAASVLAMAWGLLIAHKNKLLKHAQAQLTVANDRLEHRVEERTRELEQQVDAKERARAELAEAQDHLVRTSRQAGMAEVATGVLHNVGNVLNSVNVSTGVLKDKLRTFPVENVGKSAALIQQNLERLASFLTADPKGKALPGYLQKLGRVLLQEKSDMQNELEHLAKNIDHIKVIVAMQQSYAKVGGVLEELDPKDLLEDAIQINGAALERDQVRVVREYAPAPPVMVDRHKVLQILVNLISNAKYALREKPSNRTLTLSISTPKPGSVEIVVADNGTGINPENLSRIFSQGFTTKKDGHGFGLHSGANAAKELGGSLTVASEGLGRGATFTLQLPTAVSTEHTAAPGLPAPSRSVNPLPDPRQTAA